MALTKITSTNIQPGAIESSSLETSGATAGTYGSASLIPVLSVNAQGIVYAISETTVAGVTNFAYDSGTEVLTISTADGGAFTADVSSLASQTYVDTAVSNLVDTAPEALNTLNELAAALGDDANFATTVSTNLGNKVDKINITGATVGSSTQIPVITYNTQGQITSTTTTAVAGIDSVTFTNGTLTIAAGDGTNYTTDFDARYFTETEANANFLGINAKAADSDTLDGIESGSFLRSDANDTFTGNQLKLENSFPSAGGLLLVSDDGTATTVATATAFRVTNNGSSGLYSVLESSSGESDFVHYNNGIIELSNNTQAPIIRLTANTSQLARIEMGDKSNYTHISSRPDLGDGLMFYENGAVNTMMRDGKLGIGTTSPAYTLDVNGDSRTTGSHWLGSENLRLSTNAAGELGLGYGSTYSGNRFSVYANTTNVFFVDNSGNATAAGDITSNSDRRLKSDIKPISNALQTVQALSGKAYIKDDKANIGLIAQEVEEVMPFMVSTADDEMGTKSVNYQNMVALLIEAVKEQQEQIDELKRMLEVK